MKKKYIYIILIALLGLALLFFIKNKKEENKLEDVKNLEINILYEDKKVSLKYGDDYLFLDEIHNKSLKNKEAKNLIEKKFKDLNFKSPQSETLDLVLYNLDLKGNFTNFDFLYVDKNNETVEFDIEN